MVKLKYVIDIQDCKVNICSSSTNIPSATAVKHNHFINAVTVWKISTLGLANNLHWGDTFLEDFQQYCKNYFYWLLVHMSNGFTENRESSIDGSEGSTNVSSYVFSCAKQNL